MYTYKVFNNKKTDHFIQFDFKENSKINEELLFEIKNVKRIELDDTIKKSIIFDLSNTTEIKFSKLNLINLKIGTKFNSIHKIAFIANTDKSNRLMNFIVANYKFKIPIAVFHIRHAAIKWLKT